MTNLIKNPRALLKITSNQFANLSKTHQFLYRLQTELCIKEYIEQEVITPDVPDYKGIDLAKYHIGQILLQVYKFIGINESNYPDNELARMLSNEIVHRYYALTPNEIFVAFKLAVEQKFIVKSKYGIEHFQNFNVKYLVSIVDHYVKWKSKESQKLDRVLEMIREHRPTKIIQSRPLNDQSMKKMILDSIVHQKEHGSDGRFLDSVMFDFLREINEIKITAYELYKLYYQEHERFQSLNHIGLKTRIKKIVLRKYFNEVDINHVKEVFTKVCNLPDTHELKHEYDKIKTKDKAGI